MKYKIHSTIAAPKGAITLLFSRGLEVKLHATGGELSKSEVALLDAYKSKDGKWYDESYLVSLVKSGRLEIIGDKQLEALFAKNLSSIIEAKTPKKAPETSGDVLKRLQALESDYLRLKNAEDAREALAAGNKPADIGGENPDLAKK
jgi:hypothetical protein